MSAADVGGSAVLGTEGVRVKGRDKYRTTGGLANPNRDRVRHTSRHGGAASDTNASGVGEGAASGNWGGSNVPHPLGHRHSHQPTVGSS